MASRPHLRSSPSTEQTHPHTPPQMMSWPPPPPPPTLSLASSPTAPIAPRHGKAPKASGDRILRPRNAFFIFRTDFYARHKAALSSQLAVSQYPNADSASASAGSVNTQQDLSRAAGVAWRSLTTAEQAPWYARAEEERKRHAEMYPEYKYQPQMRGATTTGRGRGRGGGVMTRGREEGVETRARSSRVAAAESPTAEGSGRQGSAPVARVGSGLDVLAAAAFEMEHGSPPPPPGSAPAALGRTGSLKRTFDEVHKPWTVGQTKTKRHKGAAGPENADPHRSGTLPAEDIDVDDEDPSGGRLEPESEEDAGPEYPGGRTMPTRRNDAAPTSSSTPTTASPATGRLVVRLRPTKAPAAPKAKARPTVATEPARKSTRLSLKQRERDEAMALDHSPTAYPEGDSDDENNPFGRRRSRAGMAARHRLESDPQMQLALALDVRLSVADYDWGLDDGEGDGDSADAEGEGDEDSMVEDGEADNAPKLNGAAHNAAMYSHAMTAEGRQHDDVPTFQAAESAAPRDEDMDAIEPAAGSMTGSAQIPEDVLSNVNGNVRAASRDQDMTDGEHATGSFKPVAHNGADAMVDDAKEGNGVPAPFEDDVMADVQEDRKEQVGTATEIVKEES
ncbi:Repressor of filamentous growth 1 [Mycena kentingensis (nom. inval.)]|nr:Repressor of filamentous growth 1 [Mycena kentingensis (nom. inval.)]